MSSCHHSDRALIHINRKGRPATQCQHCRAARKSRTAHVKCDCGDKKKKERAASQPGSTRAGDPSTDNEGGDGKSGTCSCIQDQRCTCALKRDLPPRLPPGSVTQPSHGAATESRKPRLTATKSESTLVVFRDSHHKTAPKHNDMGHKCGLPYTIPRSHTIHGSSELSNRLMDPATVPTSAPQPGDHQGLTSQRQVKSEHNSPELAPVPTLEPLNTQMAAIFPPYGTDSTAGSPLNSMVFPDGFPEQWLASSSPETDLSIGAGSNVLSAPPVDWSTFPMSSAEVSQTPSYAGFDFSNLATANQGYLSTSPSGELSEVDDFGGPLPSLATSATNDMHDLTSVSDISDVDHYRNSATTTSFDPAHAQLLASNQLESLDIDEFLKFANESTLEQQLQARATITVDGGKSMPQEYSMSAAPAAATYEPMPPLNPAGEMSADMVWPTTMYDSTTISGPPTATPTATAVSDPMQSWMQYKKDESSGNS